MVKENVEYTLKKLKEWRDMGNGPKLAVVSNTDDRMHLVLAELGLSKYFDFILTSYETGFEKPEPEIFHKALERASLKTPQAAYHIGDGLNTDILGAHKVLIFKCNSFAKGHVVA